MSITPEQVKLRFQRFADTECKGYSSVYYELSHAVALDEDVMSFVARMPDTQPNLFLAAVQYLTGPDEMPRTGPSMNAFIRERGVEVSELMRSRRTQTNALRQEHQTN